MKLRDMAELRRIAALRREVSLAALGKAAAAERAVRLASIELEAERAQARRDASTDPPDPAAGLAAEGYSNWAAGRSIRLAASAAELLASMTRARQAAYRETGRAQALERIEADRRAETLRLRARREEYRPRQ